MNYSFYQLTVIRVSSICMDSHRSHYLLSFLKRPKGPCPELSAQRQISHLIMHHVLAAMLGKWQTKPICTEYTISSVRQTFNLHSRSNKKNQFKTRRQFHYLHNGKLLFFKLGFFFSHVSNEEKLKVTIKQKKDVKLPIQALLLWECVIPWLK